MGKESLLFVVNDGVYPFKTGGMEIFNYFLIKRLSREYDIHYMAFRKYDFDDAHFIKSSSFKPTKFTTPLSFFLYLLFHPNLKRVVFSFTPSHWILWKIYSLAVKILNIEYFIIIHHGEHIEEQIIRKYKDFFHSAKAIVAVSPSIKDNYDKICNVECITVPPLVPFYQSSESKSFYRKKYGIPENAFVIAMVGSLKPLKNPLTVLQALETFTSDEFSLINPMIVYAGGGSERDTLEAYIQERNLSKYVSFLGIIPKNDVCEIMRLTDVYLIASDFEGTSVSLLEAMYNAKPIIASSVPGIIDMVDSRSALMFNVKDAIQLKECILEYYDHVDLMSNNGRNAYDEYKSRYSYDNMITEYHNIFNISRYK